MKRSSPLAVGLLPLALLGFSDSHNRIRADEAQPSKPLAVSFDDVRDLFRSHCLRCHGADDPKAGLDLRSHEALMAGAELGPVLEPGSLEESLLWDLVETGEMPPTGDPLNESEREILRAWIEGGALPSPASATTPDDSFPPQVAEPTDPRTLDQVIEAALRRSSNVPTIELVDDEQFLRRLSYDLFGRQPTPEERAEFLADDAPDKRARRIDELLESPEFGRNWANYWSDVISYRVPPPELTFLRYDDFQDWLSDRLNANTPWDELTRELLTASGKVKDNPATTLVAFHQANPTTLASETSRIFLGVQLQCAECHDHKFDHWKREQFHGLAAFFSRAQAKLPWNDPAETVLKDKEEGEYEMPNVAEPDQKGTVLAPSFVLGQSLELGASDLERRTFLAEVLTRPDSPWFARAYVNRIWARLTGRGFFEPVDNMAGYVRHDWPEIHEALAAHFAYSGFDIKGMFRLILNTSFYQRKLPDEPVGGVPPYGVAQVSKLRGTEVFDSLVRAIELPNHTPPATEPTPEIRFPPPPKSTRTLLEEAFGFDPSLCPDEIQRNLGQAMFLMNNDQIQAQIDARSDSDTMLARMLEAESDDEKVVIRLFERVFARQPTDRELAISLEHIEAIGDRREAFEDVLWSLLNTAEFTSKH